MRNLLVLFLLAMLITPVSAAERLVVITTPESGRATVAAVDTAGAQPRTVARLNRPYRHSFRETGGAGEAINHAGADTVLLSDGMRAVSVGLITGDVVEQQSLFRGDYAPVYRAGDKLISPSEHVAIAPKQRYAIVPGFRTVNGKSIMTFALADERGETIIWEQSIGHARYANTAQFTPHGVVYSLDDTLYYRAYSATSSATPVGNGTPLLNSQTNRVNTWTVLSGGQSERPLLYNLTTLRPREDIVIPARASQFSFSPNGRWLAYEVFAHTATSDSDAGVYQVDLLTGATDRFCAGRAHNSQPTYSPGSAVLCWLEPPSASRRDTGPLRPTRLSLRQNRRTKTVDLPLQPGDYLSIHDVTAQGVWLRAAVPNPPQSASARRGLTVRYYRVPWSGQGPELWYSHPLDDGREYECFVP